MGEHVRTLDATLFRRNALEAGDKDIEYLVNEVRAALEGDSNDAEHDALVYVADFFDIDWELCA